MNNRQYKDAFLRSKVNECLHNAASWVKAPSHDAAIYHLTCALAYGRQLSPTPKNRAIRAHIVSAITILQDKANAPR